MINQSRHDILKEIKMFLTDLERTTAYGCKMADREYLPFSELLKQAREAGLETAYFQIEYNRIVFDVQSRLDRLVDELEKIFKKKPSLIKNQDFHNKDSQWSDLCSRACAYHLPLEEQIGRHEAVLRICMIQTNSFQI
jgi:hypothetical protein